MALTDDLATTPASDLPALSASIDDKLTALDAELWFNLRRLRALLALSGFWLLPAMSYVRYFAALPFDVASRCSCPALAAPGTAWLPCSVNASDVQASCAAAAGGGAAVRACRAAARLACLCGGAPTPLPPPAGGRQFAVCPAGQLVCEDDATTAARTFDLYCGGASDNGLLGVAFFLGVMGGALAGGPYSDRNGRRRTILLGAACQGVAATYQALAPSYGQFALANFASGFSNSFVNVAAFTLANELAGRVHRTALAIQMFAYFWAAMSCIVPVIAFVMKSYAWNTMSLAMAALCWIYVPLAFVYVPESPRWLVSARRDAEARKVCEFLLGDEDVVAVEIAARDSGAGGAAAAEVGTMKDLFATREVAVVTGKVMFLWTAAALSYYGISFNSGNLAENAYLDWVLLQLPQFPAVYYGCKWMDLYGRSKANTMFLGGVTVCMIVGAVLPSIATAASMVGSFFAGCIFNTVYQIVPELYPTRIRNQAMGIASASARVGSSIAVYAPYVLGGTGTLLLVCATSAAGTYVAWTMPETKGKAMTTSMPGGGGSRSDVVAPSRT